MEHMMLIIINDMENINYVINLDTDMDNIIYTIYIPKFLIHNLIRHSYKIMYYYYFKIIYHHISITLIMIY